MDDTTDSRYARAPELEDLLGLCQSLNEQGVHYILIGGFAVILQGFVRATKDIDLLIDPSVANIQKIKKAMGTLPDNAIALIADDEVENYEVVRIADEIVVDLMAKACGVAYEDAKSGIEWHDIEGVKIPVASIELLIRLKDTIRPSDKVDVNFLKARLLEEKN
jgi:hypothetical protein